MSLNQSGQVDILALWTVEHEVVVMTPKGPEMM